LNVKVTPWAIVREAEVGSAISSLMVAAERGDRPAAEALFAALYSELHRLAKRELARHGVPVRLSATTLLHEAYLDMAARDGPSFPDRARFMGYAARVMRGLVIDHARERHAQKRGGLFELTSLDTAVGRTPSTTANSSKSAKRCTSLSKWSQPSPRSLT
jgi:RNA polymerase sigma factor (TIGR02999 family)